MKNSTIVIIILLVLAFFVKAYFDNRHLNNITDIYNQNRLADSTKIVKLVKDSTVLYQRYAYALDLNKELNDSNTNLLKELGEKILTVSELKILVKQLQSSGTGDSIVIADTCKGINLHFAENRDFYSYMLAVTVDELPSHTLVLDIIPFSASVYTTKKIKDNIYSGYAVFTPNFVNDYLTIEDMTVHVDESLFSKYDNKGVHLGISAGAIIGNYNGVGLGGNVLIDMKHSISYKKGIGDNFHLIDYSYYLFRL